MNTNERLGSGLSLVSCCLLLGLLQGCSDAPPGCQETRSCSEVGDVEGGSPEAAGGVPTPGIGSGGAGGTSAGGVAGETAGGSAGEAAGGAFPGAGGALPEPDGGVRVVDGAAPPADAGTAPEPDGGAAPDGDGGSPGVDGAAPGVDGGGPTVPPGIDPRCAEGFLDCNFDPSDGCEVDPRSDALHCGACERACSDVNATRTACVAGACRPRCAAGFGSCGAPPSPRPDDGCETDLRGPSSCGACGHDCLGGACTAGVCEPYVVSAVEEGARYPAVEGQTVYWAQGLATGLTDSQALMDTELRGGAHVYRTRAGLFSNPAVDGLDLFTVQVTVHAEPSSSRAAVLRLERLNGGLTGTLKEGPMYDVERRPLFAPLFVLTAGETALWYDHVSGHFEGLAKAEIGTGAVARPIVREMSGAPWYAVADARALFASTGSVLDRGAFAEGQAHPIASVRQGTFGIDATHVYYPGVAGVARQPKTGGAEEVIVGLPDDLHVDVVVGERAAYYVHAGGLFSVAKTGGRSTLLTRIPDYAGFLTLDGGALLWFTGGDKPALHALVP